MESPEVSNVNALFMQMGKQLNETDVALVSTTREKQKAFDAKREKTVLFDQTLKRLISDVSLSRLLTKTSTQAMFLYETEDGETISLLPYHKLRFSREIGTNTSNGHRSVEDYYMLVTVPVKYDQRFITNPQDFEQGGVLSMTRTTDPWLEGKMSRGEEFTLSQNYETGLFGDPDSVKIMENVNKQIVRLQGGTH